MKKLLTLMIMLGLFAMPSITTQAAITIPTTWHYKFTYNAVDNEFQFSNGTNTYTPEFTRTADGIYFNYYWTGDADGLLPFEITLDFRRSNSVWTLGTTGYIVTDTKIGADGTVGGVEKIQVIFDNLTDKDYFLYYDNTTIGNTEGINFRYIINGRFQSTSFANDYIYYFSRSNATGNKFSIGSHDIVEFRLGTSGQLYTEGFYLQDLGTSAAVQSTTAFDSGYTFGYGEGYLAGVEEDNAYALGYAKGLSEGADMETGSSIIVFVVGAIGFIMMIFGFTTKRRIFNLLSVGAFIVLGGLLAQYVGFIIITIGLVIVNVYYTFWGEI